MLIPDVCCLVCLTTVSVLGLFTPSETITLAYINSSVLSQDVPVEYIPNLSKARCPSLIETLCVAGLFWEYFRAWMALVGLQDAICMPHLIS